MPEGLDVKPPTEYFGHDSKVRLRLNIRIQMPHYSPGRVSPGAVRGPPFRQSLSDAVPSLIR